MHATHPLPSHTFWSTTMKVKTAALRRGSLFVYHSKKKQKKKIGCRLNFSFWGGVESCTVLYVCVCFSLQPVMASSVVVEVAACLQSTDGSMQIYCMYIKYDMQQPSITSRSRRTARCMKIKTWAYSRLMHLSLLHLSSSPLTPKSPPPTHTHITCNWKKINAYINK